MVRLWGLRVREDQKEEETMKLHRLRAWCACQSPMNISLSQPYRDFTISIMTLEEVWFPLAPSASHDPEWRSSFNPSVRTNPFISTGKVSDQCADQKTTFFGDFAIYPRVVGVATRPRDIECWPDYQPKPASSGNPGFG